MCRSVSTSLCLFNLSPLLVRVLKVFSPLCSQLPPFSPSECSLPLCFVFFVLLQVRPSSVTLSPLLSLLPFFCSSFSPPCLIRNQSIPDTVRGPSYEKRFDHQDPFPLWNFSRGGRVNTLSRCRNLARRTPAHSLLTGGSPSITTFFPEDLDSTRLGQPRH